MKKLKLDPDSLRVDSFDPAPGARGEGTVIAGQVLTFTCQLSCANTCGQSCFVTCQFTCRRTCYGGTCELTCQLTCPITCDASCFTCDPVGCGDPTGPIC